MARKSAEHWSWSVQHDSAEVLAMPRQVYDVLAFNLRTNPWLQDVTMLEQSRPGFTCSAVSPAFIETIVGSARDCGPLANIERNHMPRLLSTAVDHAPTLVTSGPAAYDVGHLMFHAQELYSRNAATLLRVDANLNPLSIVAELCWPLTLETALFPHLFPHAAGGFNGRVAFHIYMQLRASQQFSLFSLYKPYLLLLLLLSAIDFKNSKHSK